MPPVIYLSLGSNLGNRAAHLRLAVERLQEAGTVSAVSSFYETEPVGVKEQPWFVNGVAALETEKTPRELLDFLLRLEKSMGRDRRLSQGRREKGPRTIDIDILLFGDRVIQEPGLTIPHPAMHERRFVLEPLTEIAPEVIHPVLKKTSRVLLASLPPGQQLRRF